MARYRKVDPRVWRDERFNQLSPLKPTGQGLWLWFLTNPVQGSIPGLIVAGELTLADNLNWSVEGLRIPFQELLSIGLVEHDPVTRLTWIPKALKYNMPENKNVVKSWKTQFEELPECALKTKAINNLKEVLGAKSEGLLKGLLEWLPERYA